jgi:hypothetical protein
MKTAAADGRSQVRYFVFGAIILLAGIGLVTFNFSWEGLSELSITIEIAFATVIIVCAQAVVALYNADKSVQWKQAEIAARFMKDFGESDELLFAARAIDRNAGLLAVPEELQAYFAEPKRLIDHNYGILNKALTKLTFGEIKKNPELQIYRTCVDSFLTWLSVIANGLDRGLFTKDDMPEIGYWVAKIKTMPYLMQFIGDYDYEVFFKRLEWHYRDDKNKWARRLTVLNVSDKRYSAITDFVAPLAE